jgi:hypothetical protein
MKDRFWPIIDDADSARGAVDRAARITTIWAVLNLAIGLISVFSGLRVTERNTFMDSGGSVIPASTFVIFGLLFAVVAWKMRAMSRGWTVAGLILAAITLLSDLAAYPSPIALVFHLVVLIYFINALRGVTAFARLQCPEPLLPYDPT